MSEVVKNDVAFVIDSDVKAEWALQKIREARANCERFVKWYKDKIKQITEQCEFDTANLERMLEDYFNSGVLTRETKTEIIYDLPTGKICYKKQNPEYTRNDAEIIEWLETHDGGQYVKVKKELDWSALKKNTAVSGGKLFDENGEEIPGVEVTERPAKFVVEV